MRGCLRPSYGFPDHVFLPIFIDLVAFFRSARCRQRTYGTRSSIGVSLFGVLTPVASSCGYDTSGQQFL
jgi:hypothetical protein